MIYPATDQYINLANEALENGEVMYEFRFHGNQERISKNHGTGFRMFPKNFPVIYGKKEEI